jgi:hypothetical protein
MIAVGYANVGQLMHGPVIGLKETLVHVHDICGQEAVVYLVKSQTV